MTASILKLLHACEDRRYLASPAFWLFAAAVWFSKGIPSEEPLARAWKSWRQVAPVTGLFTFMGIVIAASGTAAYLLGH